jgi:hypothetical protein
MGVHAPEPDTEPVIRPTRGLIVEAVIVIFLLFFAVLAFGWFYLQRAKARDAAVADGPTPAADTAVAGTPATPVDPAEPELTRTDSTAS